MIETTINIQSQPLPCIETYRDLMQASRVLAGRPAAYLLGKSIRMDLAGSTDVHESIGWQDQIGKTVYALNLVSQQWTTFSHAPNTTVFGNGPCVRREPLAEASGSNTDLVVGRHLELGTMNATFMTATQAYSADPAAADKRLSELLAVGQTDPELVDPTSIVQGTVGEGEMLLYRPLGDEGLPLLRCFDVARVVCRDQVTMFGRTNVA